MRRLATLAAVSLLVAACGSVTPSGSSSASAGAGSPTASAASGAPSSPGTSDAPGTSPAPSAGAPSDASAAPGSSAGPDASTAPGASAPAASAPAASAAADCATLNDAIATVDVHMQLMEGMDSSIWAALTDPAAGSDFDIGRFKAAVATVSAFPGAKTLAADLKEVVRLMGVTLKTSKPFTSGYRPGVQLADTVERLFIPVAVGLRDLRAAQGCPAP
jgi:hypothetical protein